MHSFYTAEMDLPGELEIVAKSASRGVRGLNSCSRGVPSANGGPDKLAYLCRRYSFGLCLVTALPAQNLGQFPIQRPCILTCPLRSFPLPCTSLTWLINSDNHLRYKLTHVLGLNGINTTPRHLRSLVTTCTRGL